MEREKPYGPYGPLGNRTSELIGDYHAEWLNRIAIKVFIYLFIYSITHCRFGFRYWK